MKKKLIFLFMGSLLFLGCARNSSSDLSQIDCARLFVLLPPNYVIDLEADSQILLNPAAHEFIVFCTVEDALAARKKAIAQGLLPESGKWLVYELEGDAKDIAGYCNARALCLKSPAKVTDWVKEEESI